MSPVLQRRVALLVGMAAYGSGGCGSGFGDAQVSGSLVITIIETELGSPESRLPLEVGTPRTVVVRVEARRADGSRDENSNAWVRFFSQPGDVIGASGPRTSGRNVQLERGLAERVEVSVQGAFGNTRVWAADVGYVPVDPVRTPPPACSNGIDDDGDGRIDYPDDPGCAAANDDEERSGTLLQSASQILYVTRPRIADLRGAALGGAVLPFRSQAVDVDTGWRAPQPDPDRPGFVTPPRFDFATVITRISGTGFYMVDTGPNALRDEALAQDPGTDPGYPYASIFAFTFSAPGGVGVCDRIRTLTGTSTEFFGQAQMASPSFTVEARKQDEPCLVPEPYRLLPDELDPTNRAPLFRQQSALVRVATDALTTLRMGGKLGRNRPTGPEYLPTEDATNCDIDGNGTVQFDPAANAAEATCAQACDADVDCSEYSNFAARGHFQLVVDDGATVRKVQANSTAASNFSPLQARGKELRAFSGTLTYFSGGSQFTIEARCDDDVVIDLAAAPKPSSEACVRLRTETDPSEGSQ